MSDVSVSAKAKNLMDVVTDRVSDLIPKNLNVWIVALTCLIVIVALSRIMSLQKSVTELQSRPSTDEHLVRQVVRQHLEETVKAMDQQNRMQLQLRQQQMMEQARKAQQAMIEKQKEAAAAALAPKTQTVQIEVLEEVKKEEEKPKKEEVVVVKEEVPPQPPKEESPKEQTTEVQAQPKELPPLPASPKSVATQVTETTSAPSSARRVTTHKKGSKGKLKL